MPKTERTRSLAVDKWHTARTCGAGHPKRAFTLIELLVVISIIALLLAILLPSLGKARENAKSVACRSNLKQMSLAHMFYSENNDDIMCTWEAECLSLGPDDEHHFRPWPHILAPYIGETSDQAKHGYKYLQGAGQDDAGHSLGNDFYDAKMARVFNCPSQVDSFEFSLHVKYGLNIFFSSHYGLDGEFDVIKKRTAIKKPAEKILISDTMDSRPRTIDDPYTFFTNWLPYRWTYIQDFFVWNKRWDIPPADRHNRGSNCLFIDGHIESMLFEDIWLDRNLMRSDYEKFELVKRLWRPE